MSILLLGAYGTGLLSLGQMVSVPTALFLSVYVMCTAAAAWSFRGGARVVATLAFAGVVAVAVFTAWALAIPLVVGLVGFLRAKSYRRILDVDTAD